MILSLSKGQSRGSGFADSLQTQRQPTLRTPAGLRSSRIRRGATGPPGCWPNAAHRRLAEVAALLECRRRFPRDDEEALPPGKEPRREIRVDDADLLEDRLPPHLQPAGVGVLGAQEAVELGQGDGLGRA